MKKLIAILVLVLVTVGVMTTLSTAFVKAAKVPGSFFLCCRKFSLH